MLIISSRLSARGEGSAPLLFRVKRLHAPGMGKDLHRLSAAEQIPRALSPLFRRLQEDRSRANAVGFFAAGGKAIGFVVFLADGGSIARFVDIHAAGGAERGAKFRLASDEGHAVPEIARVARFK